MKKLKKISEHLVFTGVIIILLWILGSIAMSVHNGLLENSPQWFKIYSISSMSLVGLLLFGAIVFYIADEIYN